MRQVILMKLEQLMLNEARNFQDLMNDMRTYERLKRIALTNPEVITEEEIGAAKEAILEKWPTITDLESALESSGPEQRVHMRRLITEGKQLPRIRPERPVRETPDQRAARLEEKLTRLKDKAREKKPK